MVGNGWQRAGSVAGVARSLIVALCAVFIVSSAKAQTFDQFIGIGPSNIDSGYFKYNNQGDFHFAAARANGGAMTPSTGLMNSDFLAAYFGLTARPFNAPGGGTNYAVSGARVSGANTLAPASPSILQQFSLYLASTGGVANPNALYLVSAGSNDISFATNTFGFQTPAYFSYLKTQADAFTAAVINLHDKGARYIIIPNISGDFMNKEIYGQLAAAGVQFIPADFVAMRAAVMANPQRFGFMSALPGTLTSPSPSACQPPPGAYSGYGLYCISSTTPTPSVANLASANAQQTSFFSDDLHLSIAGQKIQADYYYSLLVAPSQISFLAENAIQFRRSVDGGIQQQIDLSMQRATPGFNIWFNGDMSSLKIDNRSGFPGDPSTPISGTLGATYTWASNALVGAALTLGDQSPTFSSGGGFKEREVALSVYGAVRGGPVWATAVLSYGFLNYDVHRVVPLGIAFDNNLAKASGGNFSVAGMTGYDFTIGAITHGPVAGIEFQTVRINDFVESGGSFTGLAFSNIGRESAVTSLGYRAAFDYGIWRPFAQVTWNHELIDTSAKTVTAALTTGVFPGYAMPIVQLGRDWATATVGTTVHLDARLTGLAAITAQAGQDNVVVYGGRVGLNYAFGG
ncbi:autotransporter outer membrane beta-barrel domain-containing protein [Bradyrhizobium sp. SYSU BS000235]|uniref:autotransporter outer membrane beta-barrel domain-containing protein n=1 Tax=Bradyrhizobium sp. SYSU BS000235 TaxID=3411332 RepID=UPI003C74CBD1